MPFVGQSYHKSNSSSSPSLLQQLETSICILQHLKTHLCSKTDISKTDISETAWINALVCNLSIAWQYRTLMTAFGFIFQKTVLLLALVSAVLLLFQVEVIILLCHSYYNFHKTFFKKLFYRNWAIRMKDLVIRFKLNHKKLH